MPRFDFFQRPQTVEEETQTAALVTYTYDPEECAASSQSHDHSEDGIEKEYALYCPVSILASSCAFFEKALSGDWLEGIPQGHILANPRKPNEVDLIDSLASLNLDKEIAKPYKGPTILLPEDSVSVVFVFCTSIHPDYGLVLTRENVEPVCKFADKVGHEQLKIECEEYWLKRAHLDPTVAFMAAEKYRLPKLYHLSGKILIRKPVQDWRAGLSPEAKTKLIGYRVNFRKLVAYVAFCDMVGRFQRKCLACGGPRAKKLGPALQALNFALWARYGTLHKLCAKINHGPGCQGPPLLSKLIHMSDLQISHDASSWQPAVSDKQIYSVYRLALQLVSEQSTAYKKVLQAIYVKSLH